MQSAPLVFARSGFPTSRGTQCLPETPCLTESPSGAQAYLWQVGVIADRPGSLRATGVTVEIRRAVQRRLYIVFGRVDHH